MSEYDWGSVDWSLSNKEIAALLGCLRETVKSRRKRLFGPAKLRSITDEPMLLPQETYANKRWLTVDWDKTNVQIRDEMKCSMTVVNKWRARLDPKVLCNDKTDGEVIQFFLPFPEPVSMPRWFLGKNPQHALEFATRRLANEPEVFKTIMEDEYIKRQFCKRDEIVQRLNESLKETQIDAIAAAKRVIARSWERRQELESKLRVISQCIVDRCSRLARHTRTEAANKLIKEHNQRYNGSLLDTVPR